MRSLKGKHAVCKISLSHSPKREAELKPEIIFKISTNDPFTLTMRCRFWKGARMLVPHCYRRSCCKIHGLARRHGAAVKEPSLQSPFPHL